MSANVVTLVLASDFSLRPDIASAKSLAEVISFSSLALSDASFS